MRGERFVGRHDDRRHALARDHVRHRVGLAGPRHPEERLKHDARLEPFAQTIDRLRLVARGLERLVEHERRTGIGDFLHETDPRSIGKRGAILGRPVALHRIEGRPFVRSYILLL